MKRKDINKAEKYKVHCLRLEDSIWNFFVLMKPRDKTWNLFIKELTDIIKYFKNL